VADVYDIWSQERGCRCVAKVLRPERVNDRKSQRELLREGRLLRGLCHPHIVRLYEILWVPSPVLILETLTERRSPTSSRITTASGWPTSRP